MYIAVETYFTLCFSTNQMVVCKRNRKREGFSGISLRFIPQIDNVRVHRSGVKTNKVFGRTLEQARLYRVLV